ncbi:MULTISPECIES: hypothetical protein [Bacillaceae]|uniref:Uncharacterized protein n=1 Tax=Evansella alkalicola TaxID=745819 RepID=A0ABS6JVD2_9BACI|nr:MULTISPECIES: hypothetical protein [Bacillaceae]MBU9721649.1 hypothetical protein [Bacillus alkalicola]
MKNIISAGLLFLNIIIFFNVAGCGNYITREEAMNEVKSIDLSNENIDGIMLGMVITDDKFVEEHGQFVVHPDNDDRAPDAPKKHYDLYWNGDIIIRVDKETNEILMVQPLESNTNATTMNGIAIGTSLEGVIDLYGDDYYIYEDSSQTLKEIGYADHNNNIRISFGHFYEKVTSISLGYIVD